MGLLNEEMTQPLCRLFLRFGFDIKTWDHTTTRPSGKECTRSYNRIGVILLKEGASEQLVMHFYPSARQHFSLPLVLNGQCDRTGRRDNHPLRARAFRLFSSLNSQLTFENPPMTDKAIVQTNVSVAAIPCAIGTTATNRP